MASLVPLAAAAAVAAVVLFVHPPGRPDAAKQAGKADIEQVAQAVDDLNLLIPHRQVAHAVSVHYRDGGGSGRCVRWLRRIRPRKRIFCGKRRSGSRSSNNRKLSSGRCCRCRRPPWSASCKCRPRIGSARCRAHSGTPPAGGTTPQPAAAASSGAAQRLQDLYPAFTSLRPARRQPCGGDPGTASDETGLRKDRLNGDAAIFRRKRWISCARSGVPE